MTEKPMTLGEEVERDGYAEVMLKIAELAKAVGRIPVGEWDYTFTTDPRWRICVNGGATKEWQPNEAMAVPRYHAAIMHDGWPMGLVNPAEGTLLAGIEETFIAALDAEIRAVAQP